MALPPSTDNVQHTLRAHIQVMLWKAAKNQSPPAESSDVTHFGWEILHDIATAGMAKDDPAPPELIDVIRCLCKAQGKK